MIPKVYVVSDVLDELTVEQDRFLGSLLYLGQKKPQSIKQIVTSHPLPHPPKIIKESVQWFPAFMPSLVHRSLASAYIDYLLSGCFESWSTEDRRATYRSHELEMQRDLMVRFHVLQHASQN